MSLLGLCIKNWRVTAEAILLSLLILMTTLYRNAESKIDDIQTARRVEIAVNQAIIQQVKERSQTTLKRINDEHKTVVEQAEKNAWRNFVRRYGSGTGVNGSAAVGLRIPASPTNSDIANSPKGTHGTAEGIMAFDGGLLEGFAVDCARDAGQVKQWQDWATGNGFPIEK